MKIKKGDFIEISFVGRIKDNKKIFDLTDEKVAKEENIYDPKNKYEPLIICVGQGDVVKGLDEELIDKDVGKSYTIEVPAEKAFGKKSTRLFKLISASRFKDEKIEPALGLQVVIDNVLGIIKSVSGGRILVDFNHPLAGKDLTYEIKISRLIEKDEEKISSFLKNYFNITDASVEISQETAKISAEIPKGMEEVIIDNLKKRLDKIKKIEILPKKEEKNK